MSVHVRTSDGSPMDYRQVRGKDLLAARGLAGDVYSLWASRIEGMKRIKRLVAPTEKLFAEGEPLAGQTTTFEVSATSSRSQKQARDMTPPSIVTRGLDMMSLSFINTFGPDEMIGAVMFAGITMSHMAASIACSGTGQMCVEAFF